ncbi:MAG: histidine kinase [Rikenellaceae bacterium]|nr:histidine kinase [Rikenellaceae bacterium]
MIKLANRRSLNVVMHLLGWGIIFGLPLLVNNRETQTMSIDKYIGYAITSFAFVLMFYVNYLYLIDKFLFNRRTFAFILLNAVALVAVDFLTGLVREFYMDHFHSMNPEDFRPHDDRPPMIIFKLRDYMVMSLMVGLAVAIKTTSKWFRMDAEKKELEKARAEAELQNLKSQLNPHFLFNTLNNIYSLVSIDQDKARYAIDGFSRLLRYVLYDNDHQFVPLGKEIAFIRSYIELMSLRVSDNVKISVSLISFDNNILVAPLLFMTFVENAFKHGVSNSKPSFINVTMDVKDNIIIFITENSYYPKVDPDRNSPGIGIDNLRKRMEMIYPGRYTLFTDVSGEKYVSRLTLDTAN